MNTEYSILNIKNQFFWSLRLGDVFLDGLVLQVGSDALAKNMTTNHDNKHPQDIFLI